MSPFKTVALSVFALVISAAAVQAAPHHHMKKMSHPMAHAMHHRGMSHSAAMARGSVVNADHSADALNAQSLTRSQGPAQ